MNRASSGHVHPWKTLCGALTALLALACLTATSAAASNLASRHPTKGPDSAAVRIVVFTDFECPFCSRSAEFVRRLQKRHGDALQVALVNFPLPFHSGARPAALAALAAWRQGRFWPMHDILFAAQRELHPDAFVTMAGELGLDVERFKRDSKDPRLAAVVERDLALGRRLGIDGTPTVFVNGIKVGGLGSQKIFDALVQQERDAARKAGRSGQKWLIERTAERNPALVDAIYLPGKPKAVSKPAPPAPTKAPVLGNCRRAKVKMTVWCDLAVPACTTLSTDIRRLMGRYGAQLCVSWRHAPRRAEAPGASRAAAAICAGQQGAFWPMLDILASDPTLTDEEGFVAAAGQLHLNARNMEQCLSFGNAAATLKNDARLAAKQKVSQSPVVLVGATRMDAPVKLNRLLSAIDKALKNP